MESSTRIEWQEWNEAAFEQARRSGRPILLNIVASWCVFCRELDQTTFSDEEVIRRVREAFVPIRVDKDRRPDINERYNAGGWPTIAFLTPQGELLTAETFLESKELLELLGQIERLLKEAPQEVERKIREFIAGREEALPEPGKPGQLSPQIITTVTKTILDQFDPVYGGFGEGQKFPHAESIDFSLIYFLRTGDGRMRDVVVYTLDHMIAGEIHDKIEGGFFRYSTKRDWRIPHYEKMLDANAGALRFLLEAYQVFGKPEYKQAAGGILAWAEKHLFDPETGCFFGSQDADPEYYAMPLADRKRREPPRVDRTIYTNANALMISSLYKAAAVLEDESCRKLARNAMDFLLAQLHEPGQGMYHYWDGTYHIGGLLTDQAYTLRALVDTVQHTGLNSYLAAAEDLFETLEKRQASPEGGYFDIQRDPRAQGGLKRQNRSILENAVMAEALLRLYYFTRKERYHAAARATLQAAVKDYKQYGYYVAGYARSVDLFFHEPLLVEIVGSAQDPITAELHRAALSRYIPTRIVQTLDPKTDAEFLSRAQRPVREKATAYVSIGKVSYAETSDPRELPSIMEMADRDRVRE